MVQVEILQLRQPVQRHRGVEYFVGSLKFVAEHRIASIAAIATMPAFNAKPGTPPASRRPSVTTLRAVRATAHASPARPPLFAIAIASSGTTSSASTGRAPCAAQPSVAAASGGTAISASHVSPSATAGSSAIAATTTAIESGKNNDHARPPKRASDAGIPARGIATIVACVPTSTEFASTNCPDKARQPWRSPLSRG
jgi:hypothetical protein